MRPIDQLSHFVHDALSAGHGRAEIDAALSEAGWSRSEISGALGSWAEGDFRPPVPRPRPMVSAREAFTYALMFLTLAVSAWHLTSLSFSLIDLWLPEPDGYDMRYYAYDSMRWSVATLVIFLPAFLWLNRRIQRQTRSDPARRRSSMRKWIGYLTLFLAVMSLAGDAIYCLYTFLNGDLTLRVLAKAGVVAVIAGTILLYFRGEVEDGQAD